MPLLELLLALAVAARAGEPETVVTFDNGEFNLPLYTPRWNGRWVQPSVAQEIVTGVARVRGENPRVFSYLPPGRTAGRPGAPYEVRPRRAACDGPAEAPSDPCWCGPADNCWDALAPNYHPEASTSLYLTAAAVREQLRSGADGAGPRVEVHVADLFEEDPSAAADPADSDRCVTLAGTRKAIEGLVRVPAGASLDHLAIGVLRARVEPPPPGGSWGWTYDLVQDADGRCWSGHKGFAWESVRAPLEVAMAVLVLGVDTADAAVEVDAFLDGLVGQLTSDHMSLELVRLREPAAAQVVTGALLGPEPDAWRLPAPSRLPRLPCGEASGQARLAVEGRPVAPEGLVVGCDGTIALDLSGLPLQRALVAQAGMNPSIDAVTVTGEVVVVGDEAPVLAAAAALAGPAAGGDRPLPLWSAVGQALQLEAGGATSADRPWRPWTYRAEIRALTVAGVDTRPWALALVGALASAIAAGLGLYVLVERSAAARTLRAHWERNVGPGNDPLRQRPFAAVIAEAQEELRHTRGRRMAAAWAVGAVVAVAALWLLLRLHALRLHDFALFGMGHG